MINDLKQSFFYCWKKEVFLDLYGKLFVPYQKQIKLNVNPIQ